MSGGAVAPAVDHFVGDAGHVVAVGAHALAVERRHHEATRLLVRRVLLEDDRMIAEEEADRFGVAQKVVVAAGGERADGFGIAHEHLRRAARQAQREQIAEARPAVGEKAVGICRHAHQLQRCGQTRTRGQLRLHGARSSLLRCEYAVKGAHFSRFAFRLPACLPFGRHWVTER